MTLLERLRGAELVDCARANGKKGVEIAVDRCGYSDIATFEQELKAACDAKGIEIQGFDDLVSTPEIREPGIEIAPDSPGQL